MPNYGWFGWHQRLVRPWLVFPIVGRVAWRQKQSTALTSAALRAFSTRLCGS